MAIESDFDRQAFTSPSEFGDSAELLHGLDAIALTGFIDTYADVDRTGSTSSPTGGNPWLAGVADISTQITQFVSLDAAARQAVPEDTLTVQTGDYAGTYRINRVMREGEMTVFLLNEK